MGKLFNTIVLSGIIQLSLALFDKQGLNFTPVLNLFLNPTAVGGSAFWLNFITSGVGLVGLAGIVIGALIIRQDWLIRAGMFVTLFSWVIFPFIGLWNFIAGKLANLTGSTCSGLNCQQFSSVSGMGGVIAAIIVGPLILYSIWSCIEYIWSGDH